MKSVLAVAVAVVIAGCGGGADSASSAPDTAPSASVTTSTASPTSAPTTSSTTTTSTTTSTTTEPPASEPVSVVGYLAMLHRANAELVQTQLELGRSGGSLEDYVALWEDMTTRQAALSPPPEAVALHDSYASMYAEMAQAWREFAAAAEEDHDAAYVEFVQQIGALGAEISAIDMELRNMVEEVLITRDDPTAAYLLDVFALQEETEPVLKRLFGAFENLASDPEGAIQDMLEMTGSMGELASGWEQLTPPANLAALQDRQIEITQTYLDMMAELTSAFETGEDLPMSFLTDLNETAQEAAKFSAAWSLAIADYLESIDSQQVIH